MAGMGGERGQQRVGATCVGRRNGVGVGCGVHAASKDVMERKGENACLHSTTKS